MNAIPGTLLARTLPVCILALALCPLSAAPLRAQGVPAAPGMVVTGQVLDVHTGAPLPEAIVSVPRLKLRAATDARGNFTLRGITPGAHRWVVHRLGYASWEQELEAEDGAEYEVRLLPRPIVLEGISVTVDRLETRRRAVATSVRAVTREQILSSAAATPLDLLRRAGVWATPCSAESAGTECAYVRGRLTRVAVVIDERPAPGGLEQLAAYLPQEIYLIETYGGGTGVRAYTTWFMEQVAKGKARLNPTLRW